MGYAPGVQEPGPLTGAPVSLRRQIPERTSCQIRNLAANNLNSSLTPVNIDFWDVATFEGDVDYTPSQSGILVARPGIYLVSGLIYYTSNATRVNIGISVMRDGSIVDPVRSAGGYIRDASGHNEASSDYPSYRVRLSDPAELSFSRVRLAGGGTVTAPAGFSFLKIERLFDLQ